MRAQKEKMEKQMDVMGVAKEAEDHPRIAIAAKAHSSKPVKVGTGMFVCIYVWKQISVPFFQSRL